MAEQKQAGEEVWGRDVAMWEAVMAQLSVTPSVLKWGVDANQRQLRAGQVEHTVDQLGHRVTGGVNYGANDHFSFPGHYSITGHGTGQVVFPSNTLAVTVDIGPSLMSDFSRFQIAIDTSSDAVGAYTLICPKSNSKISLTYFKPGVTLTRLRIFASHGDVTLTACKSYQKAEASAKFPATAFPIVSATGVLGNDLAAWQRAVERRHGSTGVEETKLRFGFNPRGVELKDAIPADITQQGHTLSGGCNLPADAATGSCACYVITQQRESKLVVPLKTVATAVHLSNTRNQSVTEQLRFSVGIQVRDSTDEVVWTEIVAPSSKFMLTWMGADLCHLLIRAAHSDLSLTSIHTFQLTTP